MGIALLKPYALFGLDNLDPISHALFWSLSVNLCLFIGISLFSRQTIAERGQGVLFVDVFKRTTGGSQVWRGTASIRDLRELVGRFLGANRTQAVFAAYARHRGLTPGEDGPADAVAEPGVVACMHLAREGGPCKRTCVPGSDV